MILYCYKCQKVVIEVRKGKVKKGTVVYCKECAKPKQDAENEIYDIFDVLGINREDKWNTRH